MGGQHDPGSISISLLGSDNRTQAIRLNFRDERSQILGYDYPHRFLGARGAVSLCEFLHQSSRRIQRFDLTWQVRSAQPEANHPRPAPEANHHRLLLVFENNLGFESDGTS